MVDKSQENILPTSSESYCLTPENLRMEVRSKIEQLSQNVFRSLQEIGTESLVVYLISISIEPIVKACLKDPESSQELIETIWTNEHVIVERYIEDKKLDLGRLADSVQAILEMDEFGARVFERLLIFTEVIPSMEEFFHLKEWTLRQLLTELRGWHRSSKLQRLDVTIPSDQFTPATMSRGALQIQVRASKPTIIAGQEFSVFVVINNPFDVPIILHSVETQIPVELVDVYGKQRQRVILADESDFKRPQRGLWNDILCLTWDRWRMALRMKAEPENRIAQAIAATEAADREGGRPNIAITQSIENLGASSRMVGVQIDKYQTIDLEIDSISPKHLDNILWRLEAFKKGVIPIILQPGDAVVKQFIFRTKSWLFFTPLTHTLQIQVRHGVDDRDHLNTVPYELSVQSALTATMVGAVLGGTVGGVARLLSELQSGNMNVGTQIISLILAVILSAIAVVSFARKSGAQQIVSIEDFWGGLFLGFLIGFLGQNYALDLITPNSAGN
jgi:hypothetical protein